MPDWTEVVEKFDRNRRVVYCKDGADSHACAMLLKELGFQPINEKVAYHFNEDNNIFDYPHPSIYRDGKVSFTAMASEATMTYPEFAALVESLDTDVDESITLSDILGGELI